MASTEALEITVTAPVVSFRDPLYEGIQVGLICPPPSTVGGLLASTLGSWDKVPSGTRFAMAFHAEGSGTDLETYHPAAAKAASRKATIKDREFLTGITLTVWLTTDLELWEGALRTPVWPMRLGRSQDLAAARTRRVQLDGAGTGRQGHALIPDSVERDPTARLNGEPILLTTAVTLGRDLTSWDTYRYAEAGADALIAADYVTEDGQAVVLLPPAHPDGANA